MSHTAAGTFEVVMSPEPPYDANDGASIARASLKKQFKGDVEASSTGEMIGARCEVQGSAGYVAVERVVGSVNGLNGSFVLQHSGTMTRGKGELTVTVVPDSGTGDLKTISGKMTIEIVDGKHLYNFAYAIDPGL